MTQENKEVWNSYATHLPTTVAFTSPFLFEPEKIPVVQTYTTYIVASGDSISVIAKLFQTTVTNIKELNHLTTDTIYIGQN